MKVRSIEVSGATVETAIDEGLSQLGLTRDQVQVEVIREASRGVLGFGAREAVVKLTEIQDIVSEEPPKTAPIELEEEEFEEEYFDDEEEDFSTSPISQTEPHVKRTPEEILSLSRDILAELLEKMQIDAEIEARIEPPRFPGDEQALIMDLKGNDLGFLIGRKGTTLAATQHLVRLMVNKATQQRTNLIVDVEGYKVRRERALKKLALRIADKATKRNRRIALEPMNAYERRIVHMTLRNHPTVVTESIGEKDRRKVTILPKRKTD